MVLIAYAQFIWIERIILTIFSTKINIQFNELQTCKHG
jgi:hypothetical protein